MYPVTSVGQTCVKCGFFQSESVGFCSDSLVKLGVFSEGLLNVVSLGPGVAVD